VAGPSGSEARSGLHGGFAKDSISNPKMELGVFWLLSIAAYVGQLSTNHRSMIRGSFVVSTGNSGAPTGPQSGGMM